jgi:serine/threonine protein kinase
VRRKRFNEQDAAGIIQKLLAATAYCHENNVTHRDLKPENILIAWTSDKEIEIKVIDFGAGII